MVILWVVMSVSMAADVALRLVILQDFEIQSKRSVPRVACHNVSDPACLGGVANIAANLRALERGAESTLKLSGYDLSALVWLHPLQATLNNEVWSRMGVDIGIPTRADFATQAGALDNTREWVFHCPVPFVHSNMVTHDAFPGLRTSGVVTAAGRTVGILPVWGNGHFLPTHPIGERVGGLARLLRQGGVDIIVVVAVGDAKYFAHNFWTELVGVVDIVVTPLQRGGQGGILSHVNGTWVLGSGDS
eukprot:Hpha_TRINITY_DN30523_c0_g1::TRINITY_DN30523_c0_g1_i1::g.193562::m.193562